MFSIRRRLAPGLVVPAFLALPAAARAPGSVFVADPVTV